MFHVASSTETFLPIANSMMAS